MIADKVDLVRNDDEDRKRDAKEQREDDEYVIESRCFRDEESRVEPRSDY